MSSLLVLVDCTPLSVGGGVQVGIALLEGLATQSEVRWKAVVTEAMYSALTPAVTQDKTRFFVAKKDSLLDKARTALALRRIEAEVRPDLVFSVFGPPYFNARAPHLVGFALPHLIYDPIPVVDRERWGRRALARLFAAMFRRADHLVVETNTVRDRVSRRLGIAPERIGVIETCVNPIVQSFAPTPPPVSPPFVLLTPAAPYPHKNLPILPEVAAAWRRLDPEADFRFRLTVDFDHPVWVRLVARATDLGVADRIETLGTITLQQWAQAYQRAHAVFLPTLRECSTAVYPESFYFGRPLVTSDLDFAHEACGDAALYAPTRDAEATARVLSALTRDPSLQARLVEAGRERGRKVYPSPAEKLRLQIDLMRRVAAGPRAIA